MSDEDAKNDDAVKDGESNDKAVNEETALSTFQGDFSEYMEDFDENVFAGSEIRISRAALMQPGSPEIAGETPGYKISQIVDSVTREILTTPLKSPWLIGKAPDEELFTCQCCLLVPAFKLPTEFIKWKDLKTEGKGWHFKSMDRTEQRVREGIWPNAGGTWGEKEEEAGLSPPVTENCNYMMIVVDPTTKQVISNGIIFTFCKTSFKTGRALTTYIRKGFQKRIPAFGMSYWCYTVKDQNDAGQKFVYTNIVPAQQTAKTSAEALRFGMDWHKKFSNKQDGLGKKLQYAYLSAAQIEEEHEQVPTENSDGTFNSTPNDSDDEDIF